jgi:DNA-binding transcriptional MocR family regulator
MTPTRSIVIHPAAATLRRSLGAQAWAALEVIVAASGNSAPVTVAISARKLAVELGVSKNTAARALATLTDAGLISPRQARALTGTFDTGSYELTVNADVIRVDALITAARHERTRDSSPASDVPARRDQPPAQLSLLDAG